MGYDVCLESLSGITCKVLIRIGDGWAVMIVSTYDFVTIEISIAKSGQVAERDSVLTMSVVFWK